MEVKKTKEVKKKPLAEIEDKSQDIGSDEEEEEEDPGKTNFEQTYIFALAWGVGGYLENPCRVRLESYIREKTQLQMPQLPRGDSIFNYNVNPRDGSWTRVERLLENA